LEEERRGRRIIINLTLACEICEKMFHADLKTLIEVNEIKTLTEANELKTLKEVNELKTLTNRGQ
jgi:hypothetical protein